MLRAGLADVHHALPRRRCLIRALAAFVSVLTLAGISVGSSAAAGAATSAPGVASLIIQVSSLTPYSPATVKAWLNSTCSTQVGPPPAASTVVLQDIGGADGVLSARYLDVIAPYLPGGTRPCFGSAFVGTVDLAWTGVGSKYVEGIQDPSFRQRNVDLSTALASKFVARYPKLRVGWYLTYEADLNELYYPAVEQAYASLFTAEVASLNNIHRGRVMWSPAFWFPYGAYSQNIAGMAGLRSGLSALFVSLASAGTGLDVVDLQDFVSGSACQPPSNRMTPSDVIGWTSFLQGLQGAPVVQVNVEQYAFDCSTGAVLAGDPAEILAREAFYANNGLVLGPAFELRYWTQTHGMG